ncbi:MAG: sigma-54-dependent Fis family transcriptional regulator [Planctomycetes bacterium]|nr:sigma-54-dependent Fis family transcriptional regulator [Planctomycetota bacterium]
MSAPLDEGRKARVLLVDDDDTFRHAMASELSRRGYAVSTAGTGQAALDLAAGGEIDVIFLDLRLSDLDGIEVLKRLRARDVAGRVVMLTGHGTIDTAIQAIRLGAYDYLEKPCPMDEVEVAIQKAHEHLRLSERRAVLEDAYVPPDVGPEFIGSSAAFEKVRRTLGKVAVTDSAVLILGETGVGKEMVATLLHAQSRRRDGPFVVVDCAALHENLLQSELFGHEKGAFTGAVRLRHGLFEVANDGTLFLDEVAETTPEIQAKLLRVLETGRFRRLGGSREIAVDVRLVSATNRNLKEAIARGHFREDLFFRLATVTLEIPPLRERREDIPLLVEHYTRGFNRRFSRSQRFREDALDLLKQYDWPGNVRELVHVIEQSMVLSGGDEIVPDDLPAAVRSSVRAPSSFTVGEMLPLREVGRRHVLSVLERVQGNKAQAARILQVSERNLYRLLQRYGLPDKSSAP